MNRRVIGERLGDDDGTMLTVSVMRPVSDEVGERRVAPLAGCVPTLAPLCTKRFRPASSRGPNQSLPVASRFPQCMQ
jgi:hypothetical protein